MSLALSIDDYVSGPPPLDLARPLAEASQGVAEFEAALRTQQHKFAELYQLAEGLAPGELETAAAALYAVEKVHAAILEPVIKDGEEKLRRYRHTATTATQKSMLRLTERAVDVAASWLELYRDFRLRLELMAAGRTEGPSLEVRSAEDLDWYFKSVASEE